MSEIRICGKNVGDGLCCRRLNKHDGPCETRVSAYQILADAEMKFLLARGWKLGRGRGSYEDGWHEPDRREHKRILHRGHAVNSERKRMAHLTADDADTALAEAEVAYLLARGYERIPGTDGWRRNLGKRWRTFFWREKAVHHQKALDEVGMKWDRLI